MTEIQADTSKEEIFAHIKSIFVDSFELEPDTILPAARLYEDLDIDSIDAVDLMVALKKKTGKKLDPESFKKIRTVDDVVNIVYRLLNN